MIKAANNISFRRIKTLVSRLSADDRIKLLETLEQDLASNRLRQIITSMRSKVKTTSLKKITPVVERIRQQRYDRRNQSSH